MVDIREASLPADRDAVGRLWLAYLRWGNEEMQARHGFHLPVEEAVEHDLATISAFQPPDGHILLAFDGDEAFGIGCLRRIRSDTAEIKRMYVDPARRRGGVGRALLQGLLGIADDDGYRTVWLDSPDFMTAAHGMYRSAGFTDIAPYAESEIPDEIKSYWVFMGLSLPAPAGPAA